MKRIILLGIAMLISGAANAVPITTLFGTGLDAAGTPLAGGAADPHYTITEVGSAQAVVRTNNAGTYFPNDANSQWIWQQANGQPVNVTRTFRTTFDLTGLDHATAVINGAWGTDNQGLDILINGVSTGIDLLGVIVANFSSLHAFSINSGLVAGVNTLDFIIEDNGGQSAFRAELSGSADSLAVPEPMTVFLLGIGLAGLGFAGRRVR